MFIVCLLLNLKKVLLNKVTKFSSNRETFTAVRVKMVFPILAKWQLNFSYPNLQLHLPIDQVGKKSKPFLACHPTLEPLLASFNASIIPDPPLSFPTFTCPTALSYCQVYSRQYNAPRLDRSIYNLILIDFKCCIVNISNIYLPYIYRSIYVPYIQPIYNLTNIYIYLQYLNISL